MIKLSFQVVIDHLLTHIDEGNAKYSFIHPRVQLLFINIVLCPMKGGVFLLMFSILKRTLFQISFDKAGKLPQKLTFGENCEQMRTETG